MAAQRTALVTGASRGIGAAIAHQLVADGIYVIGTATTETGVATIEAALGNGGEAIALRLDQQAELESAMAELAVREDGISIVVNNAGITADNLFMRMSTEAWSTVIATNLTSLHAVVKPLIRQMMRDRWGRIINIGSVVARSGNPGQTNYVASKAGIEGFTRALGLELATRGVTVNCVAPGFIDTDMTKELNEKQVEATMDRIPMRRIGTPDDVAHAVSFLASDASGYITGQTLQVNGGMFLG